MDKIRTIDLINICNIAKSFKQKDFVLMNNRLYGGIDNNKYMTFTSQFNDISYMDPIQFNYKELSDFIKSITTEIDFELVRYGNYYIITNNLGAVLHLVIPSQMLLNFINSKIYYNLYIESINYGDITNELSELFTMKKVDGIYSYIKDKYFIIIFPGLLPVNKGDRIELSIIDMGMSFICIFRIIKKNIEIFVDLRMRKV